VTILCHILQVSRSGYYDFVARQGKPAGPRQSRRAELTEKIRQVHERSRRTYGSPRVHRELKSLKVSVCQNTVAKYMRLADLRPPRRRRYLPQTTDSAHDHPIAANVLDQDFRRPRTNQAWCSDITYIPTAEGWLYLAAVIDLCSRRIVGWAMADHLRAALCSDALAMALEHRRPPAGLLHHSDRGCQYACAAYRGLLEEHDVLPSMSRAGNCYDNAVMESFFATLKRELVNQTSYATRLQARRSIFEYIEVFYNRKRRHSSLGYVSPLEFEASLK
jgi:putative transposase